MDSSNRTADPTAHGLTAVILCGGRGERLRPLTDRVPKALLPVNGRPLLDYLIDHLFQSGITEFVLCTGYKAELFEEFASRRELGAGNVSCSNSGEAGMTQRLVAARPLIPGRALVCYADTLADVDLKKLVKAHEAMRVEGTLTVHPCRSPFGIVTFDETGLVSAFQEKPQLPYWINIGFLLLEPMALSRLNSEVPMPDFLVNLAAQRGLGVYRHLGRHWTANTETELRELAENLRSHWNNEEKNDDTE
jgi:glucose-1-phosphate cytidylyltransferase